MNWNCTLMDCSFCYLLTRASSYIDVALLQSMKKWPLWLQFVQNLSFSVITTYLIIKNLGSWVAKANIIKSASAPYMQWDWFKEYSFDALSCRMKSIILCSPSPGQFASEKTTIKFFQNGWLSNLFFTYYLILLLTLFKNYVPGVMTFESNPFLLA